MDDFTQRLLEKKNARKRKQEEASAALKNINLPSESKKSPTKYRNPLVEKNTGHLKNPVPIPRKDIASVKTAEDSLKKRTQSDSSFERKSENKPHSTSRYGKTQSESSNSVISKSRIDSHGGLAARPPHQHKTTKKELVERKNRRQFEMQRERNVHQIGNHSNMNQDVSKIEKPSSISDRLAIFESKQKVIDKRKIDQIENADKIFERDHNPRHPKEKAMNKHPNEPCKLPKTSSRKASDFKTSHLVRSTDAVDTSCSLDFDSDENPFDVSAILREADKAEQREMQQTEYAKANWSVNDYVTGCSSINATEDKGASDQIPASKRASIYSTDGNEEEMSVFAKQIAQKRKQIKSPKQEINLNKIDRQNNERKRKDNSHNNNTQSDILDNHVDKEKKHRGENQIKERKPDKRQAPKVEKEQISANDPPGEMYSQESVVERKPPPKPARKHRDAEHRSLQIPETDHTEPMMKRVSPKKECKESQFKDCQPKIMMAETDKSKKLQHGDKGKGTEESKRKQEKDSKTEQPASAKKVKHSGEEMAKKKPKQPELSDIKEYESETAFPQNSENHEMMFSPNSNTYKSVREKKSAKPRKNMRRSMSFSEGHPAQTHKSGYNEEASSRYNVVTNCIATVQEEKSNFDKIKELLDYAASQQNIVIQASQALNMSLHSEDRKGSPEIVEGERLLLLANERKTACLDEVEKLKHGKVGRTNSEKSSHEGACPPCNANIVISDIKLPLNGDFLLALRGGRMDLGVFHFVVLVEYGPTQIYSTKVRCTYDELSRNFLTFREKIELTNVPHDFILTVKVYGMHTKRGTDSTSRGKKQQQSKDSPGLMKNVFSSLTPRRRVNSADDSPVRGSSPKPVFRTTSFTPCGSTKINLALINTGKHVLTQVPKNCPLEGFVELNVDCRPLFTASARGFLTILEEVGDYTAWNRRWCVMEGSAISFWRFPDEETSKPPIGCIDLTSCVNKSVDLIPRHECSRPNTFELTVKRPLAKTDAPSLLSTIIGKEVHIKSWVSADNKDDRIAWMQTLNRQLSDSTAWSGTKHRGQMSSNRDCNQHLQKCHANAVAV